MKINPINWPRVGTIAAIILSILNIFIIQNPISINLYQACQFHWHKFWRRRKKQGRGGNSFSPHPFFFPPRPSAFQKRSRTAGAAERWISSIIFAKIGSYFVVNILLAFLFCARLINSLKGKGVFFRGSALQVFRQCGGAFVHHEFLIK